jgi:type I restriction enzyme S subunit
LENLRAAEKGLALFSEATFKRLHCTEIVEGDCLVSRLPDPVGRSCLLPEMGQRMITAVDCTIIRFKRDLVEPKYFLYFAQSDGYFRQVERLTTGATRQRISRTNLGSIVFPRPPLPEQQRIVAILDKAFEKLAIAGANAEKNLKNARELFDSYLGSIFTKTGEGWTQKTLGQVSEIVMGQSPPGDSYNSRGAGVPLINGPVEFGKTPFSETLAIKFTTAPTKLCKKGDVILCVRGSTTGRMNIAGHNACIGRGVAAIRSREFQEWVKHFINFSRGSIYRLGTGATFPNVSGEVLAKLPIVIPPKDRQEEVIGLLNSLSQRTSHLEGAYQRKIDAIDELRQSILQKAFSDELISPPSSALQEAAE